jgi:AcrR family transcriptional regulator
VPAATAARDRLLRTAGALFYAEGITATGVDRIVAQAGVTKPTLYAHFASKAALVAAVLEDRGRRQRASLEAYLAECREGPAARLLAVFDWLGTWQSTEGVRGCAFVNAAAELSAETEPARAVITSHKRWLRQRLAELASEAGCAGPDEVGEELLLLIEGSNARMLIDGDRGASARARRAAEILIGAAGSPSVVHGAVRDG